MRNKFFLSTVLSCFYCTFLQAQCPDSRILTFPDSNFEAGYRHIETNIFIEASNTVTGSAKIAYDAGEYVLLQSGFYAASSEPFWALIDGCDGKITDTKESALSQDMLAVPNPTTGLLQVRLAQPSDHALSIACFDLLGRELLRNPVPPGSNTADLDLSALPPGIYLVQLMSPQARGGRALKVVRQ